MKAWFTTLCLLALTATANAALQPTDLRCEYLRDPLGIDALPPRLSWVLDAGAAPARGEHQTAWQVLVASRADDLAAGRGDLWNSGKVASDQSLNVAYAGATLRSGEECFWKVRVWDAAGHASAWSQPAHWSMGLLQPGDWKARWIGKDETEQKPLLTGAAWIWFPEGNPATAAPVGTRWFRREVALPADRAMQQARLLMTADNEFTVFVNGEEVGGGGNFHVASVFDLATRLKPGRNLLAVRVKNSGDAPNPAGLLGRLEVNFNDGEPLVVATDESWKSTTTETAGWEKAGLDDASWSAAKNLGPAGMAPWGAVSGPEDRRLPARMLRHEFTLAKPVRRAMVYFSGLGLSELYLNGAKVGDAVLSPALSEYEKRAYYVSYDVTRQLRPGANAVGAWLGNGRYYAPRLSVPTATMGFGYPKLIFQMHIEFADGTAEEVVSDDSWKLTTDGPIRANNEYDGEDYDARKEMPGWAQPGFDDARWEKAQFVDAPTFDPNATNGVPILGDRPRLGHLFRSAAGRLSAQMMPPIRVTETLKPRSVKELAPGVFIFDLGQNMVGWCRLKVNGPRGTVVTMRHAETLRPDGSLYLDNIRSAKVTDTYTLKGGGPEVYEPRFTYHGFRFVEVRGFPGRPDLSALEGRVVHDDLESAGDWTCSNPLLNRIYTNVRWGVRGNYRSISTDCPQRDERQGWLGDRSAESKGETYLFNTLPLYAKWVRDMADAQKPDGSVPDVCPAYWPIYSDNVTWPSSTVIIPEHLFTQFADTALLARHYASMKRWMDHMAGYLKDDLLPRDTYGDWCVPPENPKLIHSQDPARKTAGPLLGTAYYYHCLNLMAGYATLLGKTDDAARFRELAGRMKTAFNRAFLKADGSQYDNGSQTSCVLPLAFGLVPDADRGKIFDHLVEKITGESHRHIGTGLIGGQFLMETLTDGGRGDLACTLATNTTYPSWGYMIAKGATTIWELWNGDTADPAMNSGNHVMLVGDLLTWLYEDLAGIAADPRQPGFKHIVMHPHCLGDLRFVRATHRSPYGLIVSAWRQGNGRFDWEITVPPNTTATVFIPAANAAGVTEGGRPVAQAQGVRLLRHEDGCAVCAVASGRYHFTSR
jgi:alpha-L-rhamnosidase